MNIRKIVIFNTIFVILITSCFFGISHVEASSTNQETYYISSNRGPRLKYTTDNPNKFLINVVDNNGIKSIKVEKYDKNTKLTDISSKLNISNDKKTIEIPKDYVGDSLKIKITATDNTNNYSINILTVYKLLNSKKYFVANLSPRITLISNPSVEERKITSFIFKATDNNQIQSVVLTDLNTNEKVKIQTEKYDGKEYITCKLDSLKDKDSIYKIKIEAKDTTGNTNTEQLFFKIMQGNKSTPYFIAHRGASKLAEGNTVQAFKKAADKNADLFGIETDIRVTKDNKLVCVHDETVSEKAVKDVNYDYLAQNNIATFEQYIDVVKKSNKCAVIELKNETSTASNQIDISGGTETINKVIKKIENEKIAGKSIVMAFDYESLYYIRNNLKNNVYLCYLIGNPTKEHVDKAAKLGRTILGCNAKHIKQEIIDYAHKKGVKVNVYTADDYAKQSILNDMGADLITTNVVDMK